MTTTAAITVLLLLVGYPGSGPLSSRPSTGVVAQAQPVSSGLGVDQRVESIRDALLRLPYYGVFDFLAFKYDKGTVTLDGYAYAGRLKQDAERAVRRVSGVDDVVNNIVDLPASLNDDEIRWRAFYALYTNDFLSKYAPGAGFLWGRRGISTRWSPHFGVFPGDQPVGSYPIHVVVERGKIRLLGVVDNETDKNVATIAARGVSGTFGVENELVVDAGQ